MRMLKRKKKRRKKRMRIFLLRCPKCKNTMKYGGRDSILTGKRKVCVYCGRSFLVRKHIAQEG